MACETCQHSGKPRVTLVTGRVVCTWCDDWRHECEARHVLNLPTLAERRAYLYGTPKFEFSKWRNVGGIEQKRGPAALKQLEDTMTALWQRRVADAKAQVLGRTGTPANDSGEQYGTSRAA